MSFNFCETVIGQRFIEVTMKALKDIADQLTISNQLKERELKLREEEVAAKTVHKVSTADGKLRIQMEDGNSLVAEINEDPQYREIFVYVEGPKSVQDICLARQAYAYNKQGKPEFLPEQFEVAVWGNEDDEDFTEEFLIPLHKED